MMSIYAIPPKLEAIDDKEQVFPLCGKVDFHNTQAKDDYVICPMVKNLAITLGCCIDTQGVTRDAEFEENLYYDEIFAQNSSKINLLPSKMRRICIDHQISVLRSQITSIDDEERKSNWQEEIDQLVKLRSKLSTN